ncbi:MAG: DNA mismatch repair protein MutS [Flavobacteriaceae bacterium]|nr:DNA mismatch repair protein MutS [Flavobacteriaceae bacterium]|tara:strand:- start:157612 stop:158154 length:543 start_codon:yes stop_codon:yes gene_type:complete
MNIGDTVSAIDDAISGTIKALDGKSVVVETSDGFEMEFQRSELVVEGTSLKRMVRHQDISANISEKQEKKRPKPERKKTKGRTIPPMEVDLHIHQLTGATHLSNYDMLTIQLDTAKRQLEFAIAKRIQNVVFIHGVGAGVLKTELEYLFKKYDQVTFYDADYRKYGAGATHVYILQNVKD